MACAELIPWGGETAFNWWCAPCDTHHPVPVTGPRAWGYNGNLDAPTITPSIRVSYESAGHKPRTCHVFITDGKVAYLGDCTHALAGQTVPLPELP